MSDITADNFVTVLQRALGSAVLLGNAIPERYFSDWTRHAPCRPLALLRPANTAEVAKVLALCNEYRFPVIPQGGMTGLAGGAVPTPGSVALSLEFLAGDVEVDTAAGTLTAGAGATLEAVQHAAEEVGLRYPVDFGARGSCQIGGSVATNAGGHAVIRHGMTRDRVLGLEAVLADGRVLNLLNSMIKNNAGYDLKQCFIGSEGTLGVITRVVLRLEPALGETNTLLCAVADYASAVALLHRLRAAGLTLEAFEVMWQDFYAMSCGWLSSSPPLETDHPVYVLCETEGDANRLEIALEEAMVAEEVVDAVLAGSVAQARQLWMIREATAEFSINLAPISFDISLPIGQIGNFVQAAHDALSRQWPGCHIVNFGHIGDSNLHLTVDGNTLPTNSPATWHAVEVLVYDLVGEWRGSISAEHGIGLLKRDFLHHSVTENAMATMRTFKQALDPRSILNPGKVLTDNACSAYEPEFKQ